MPSVLEQFDDATKAARNSRPLTFAPKVESVSFPIATVPPKPAPVPPKHAGGRPTVMTPEVVSKLEEVFALGGTDREACFYADISHQTLYDYQNAHPEFVERKEALKERPILQARQTVVQKLKTDTAVAQWYLERKAKGEFSQRTESVSTNLNLNATVDDVKAMELTKEYENKLFETLREEAKHETTSNTPPDAVVEATQAEEVPDSGQS